MEKNPDYYKGAPKVDKVIFRPIVEDQTRLAELEGGKLDLIVNVPPDDLACLRKDGKLSVNHKVSVGR